MSVISQLSEKPWLPNTAPDQQILNSFDQQFGEKKTALKFFLGIVTVIFSLFIVTFLERSQFPDFQALAGQPWQPLSDARQLWVNTALLLISGVALQSAALGARKNKTLCTLLSLGIAVLFSLQFLLAQLWVWQDLAALGYFVASNPANSYFYLFTGIHGLHILGGLCVLAAITFKATRIAINNTKPCWQNLEASLRLCTTYWHYLFGVWMVLFALMTSSAETYQLLAALCGF